MYCGNRIHTIKLGNSTRIAPTHSKCQEKYLGWLLMSTIYMRVHAHKFASKKKSSPDLGHTVWRTKCKPSCSQTNRAASRSDSSAAVPCLTRPGWHKGDTWGGCVCVGVWRERSPGTERSFSSAERLYLLEWGPGPAGCPTGTQYPRCSQPRLLPPACAPVRRQNTEWQQYLAIFQSTYPQSYRTSPLNHNPLLKVLKCIIDPSDWSLE